MLERAANSGESPAGAPPPERRDIENHLSRVLDSAAFRGSQRSRDFLTFVTKHSLEGGSGLHERAIAVDLLGREATFDPAEDSIVRVQANEVRKRLARYYAGAGAAEPLRIELPPGGYAPQFRFKPETEVEKPAAEEEKREAPRRPGAFRLPRLAALSGAGVVLVAAIVLMVRWPGSPLDEFWQPVYDQRNPVIICIPRIGALRPESSSELWKQLIATTELPTNHQDVEFSSAGARLFLQDNMMGMGAALGALRVAVHLGRHDTPFQTRIGQEVSFADLRSHPAVLLGAFSSKWTMEMNRDLPFALVSEQGGNRIRQLKAPMRYWEPKGLQLSGRADEDYAILARVIDSTSGQIIFIAAGITTYGTQAAAECLVDRDCIARLTGGAPKGWSHKNVQAVLHTRIIGSTPGPPKIVASHFW